MTGSREMTGVRELPIEGRLVRLRDCAPADADMLDRWNADRDGGFNDFGPREPVPRQALANGPLRNERTGMLIIERLVDRTPIGTMGWRRVQSYGPSPVSDAWNIGIELIPEGRGQGYGTEAQRLVADFLFATTAANRVEASTDADNVAEQRALEKAGFRREGTLRGAQFRAGSFHDLVSYARIRGDP
jgi:RimJ/RimL family protein N-acetyltransferase